MLDAAATVLKQRFGWETFRPGQAEVIGHLLNGQSAAAVFPTGSGKSLCYQLPSLMLPGLTIVVSPLIALIKDQIDRLQSLNIAAARLDSSLTADESTAVMQAVRQRELKMLYVAPERFNNERFREAIQQTQVSLFAVDEAHCISEWGHNFRPDYLKLVRFARMCKAERLLALTATATPQVLADICKALEIQPQCAVRTGFYRPNLRMLITPVSHHERDSLLIDRLKSRPNGPTVIYVTLQRTAELVAERLTSAGFSARAYHAGMNDDTRTAVQEWFAKTDRGIVAATIAFGMGIDKSDIRYVYHYNLPKSLENFSQEIGRAGRDGELSVCEMFCCPDDLNTLENFVYADTPDEQAVRGLIEEVLSLGSDFDVSLYELSANHDIKQIVARTLLTYLELDGILEEGTPFYSKYQFRPLAKSADILAKFEGERRTFLATLFRQANKAKTWFTIDLEEAARATNSPRDRIVRALDYLGEQKLLELKVEGVRNRFKRLRDPGDIPSLVASLYRRAVERETREIARLQDVLDLAKHNGCQVAKLCEHFGETRTTPCGHCSWCLNGQRPMALLPRPDVPLQESVLNAVKPVRQRYPDPLNRPRALARFLCGISSPRLSRQKLISHELFGSLANVPFSDVVRRLST